MLKWGIDQNVAWKHCVFVSVLVTCLAFNHLSIPSSLIWSGTHSTLCRNACACSARSRPSSFGPENRMAQKILFTLHPRSSSSSLPPSLGSPGRPAGRLADSLMVQLDQNLSRKVGRESLTRGASFPLSRVTYWEMSTKSRRGFRDSPKGAIECHDTETDYIMHVRWIGVPRISVPMNLWHVTKVITGCNRWNQAPCPCLF